MSIQLRLSLAYGILVLVLLSLGAWWVYFIGKETREYQQERMHRLEIDLRQAEQLVRTVPEIRKDPVARLAEIYPHLLFVPNPHGGGQVVAHPAVVDRIRNEASRRQRMFASEGTFFLVLLVSGTAILIHAVRSEQRYKLARELFLTGATHELKTPLASLKLYTETLGRGELDDADRQRIRECMLRDVDRLETMVVQVLALAHEDRTDGEDQTPFDLSEAATDIVHELEDFFRSKDASVEKDLPLGHLAPGPRSIFCLVLRNVLTNAVHHGGRPVHIRLNLHRDGRRHLLSVSDDGPGIPRSERRRIFRAFERGSTSGTAGESVFGRRARPTGAGLGLYLVERKMKMLGGKVELESTEGRGSTFTLVLPANER